MPVPPTIDDLSTTAGSNSPAGTETPTEGDNYIRTLSAFIAQLRDMLNGTSGAPEALSLTITNTLSVGGAATFSGDVAVGDDLTVAGDATVAGTTTANGAFQANGLSVFVGAAEFQANPDGKVKSTTYTPVGTAIANVTAITPRQATWGRVGAFAWVAGQVDVTPTAGVTVTSFRLNLPFASAFTTAYQLGGAGTVKSTTGPFAAVDIEADTTNDQARFEFYSGSTAARTLTYFYGYEVI